MLYIESHTTKCSRCGEIKTGKTLLTGHNEYYCKVCAILYLFMKNKKINKLLDEFIDKDW